MLQISSRSDESPGRNRRLSTLVEEASDAEADELLSNSGRGLRSPRGSPGGLKSPRGFPPVKHTENKAPDLLAPDMSTGQPPPYRIPSSKSTPDNTCKSGKYIPYHTKLRYFSSLDLRNMKLACCSINGVFLSDMTLFIVCTNVLCGCHWCNMVAASLVRPPSYKETKERQLSQIPPYRGPPAYKEALARSRESSPNTRYDTYCGIS